MHASNIIIKFATSFKKLDILSSPIGSTAIADTLYTHIIDAILVTGTRHIPTKTIKPIPPNTPFIS